MVLGLDVFRAHPVATVFVVVATGNHFWLDAVAGAILVAVGAAAATVLVGGTRTAALWRRPRALLPAGAIGDFSGRSSGPGPGA